MVLLYSNLQCLVLYNNRKKKNKCGENTTWALAVMVLNVALIMSYIT